MLFLSCRVRMYLCASMAAVLLVGCGAEDSGLVRVKGKVTFEDGQPVTGEMATIVFQPNPAAAVVPKKSANGTIASDGSYQLMTEAVGDGAFPGEYKVVLKVWENYREQKSAVGEQYGTVQATPLEATVSPDKATFDFVIQR